MCKVMKQTSKVSLPVHRYGPICKGSLLFHVRSLALAKSAGDESRSSLTSGMIDLLQMKQDNAQRPQDER